MSEEGRRESILKEIEKLPVLDVHSHLKPQAPTARGFDTILFYHFVATELLSAGLPDEALDPGRPAEERLLACLPHLKYITGTTTYWCVKRIMRDLFELDLSEPTEGSLLRAHEAVTKTAADPGWARTVLVERAGIEKTLAKSGPRPAQEFESYDFIVPHWEGIFFGPFWFEKNILHLKEPPKRFTEFLEAWPGVLQGALDAGNVSFSGLLDSPFRKVEAPHSDLQSSYEKLLAALRQAQGVVSPPNHGRPAGEHELNALATALLRKTLGFLQESGKVLQLYTGAHWPTYSKPSHNVARSLVEVSHALSLDLAGILFEYPGAKVNLMCASAAMTHELTVLCRMVPNATLLGFWWHLLQHGHIDGLISERVDMLPSNKWILVGTDAYMAEWSYGKLRLVLESLARVLARRVEEGRISEKEALFLAERVMHGNARDIYGI